jgi:hypothetical protein
LIVTYQLEHKVNGRWEATKYKTTIETPTMFPDVINWHHMDEAFKCALDIAGCRDESINFEEIRVSITRSES